MAPTPTPTPEIPELEDGQVVELDPELIVRSWEELRDTGLLWLINRVVFHPRGWAIALQADATGQIRGWRLLGDGREVWQMPPDVEDLAFQRAQAALTPRS